MSEFKYDKTWYESLKKPWFQPPAWLFAPVWTILYVLIALSFVLVLLTPFKWINVLGYILFAVQLFLNLSWTPVFFQRHLLKEAFYLCLLLLLVVAVMMYVFYLISKMAAIILIPYLLWLSFASILSYNVYRLNMEK